MGAIGCNCCGCDLKIEDLPDILVDGGAPLSDWQQEGPCCFSREYGSLDPPVQVMSADLSRGLRRITATQTLVAQRLTSANAGCGELFDCITLDYESEQFYVERFGLLYRVMGITVFLQKIDTLCPYDGSVVKRFLVSTRHSIAYTTKFQIASGISQTGDFTSHDSCCVATDYTLPGTPEPDWGDPSVWPGGGSGLLIPNGAYWNHKIFDELPSGNVVIDGCIAPCEIEGSCTPECDKICVVSDSSGSLGGFVSCPTPDYEVVTCSFTYNNPNTGVSGCTSTFPRYRIIGSGTDVCSGNTFGSVFGPFGLSVNNCSQSVARNLKMEDRAFTQEDECSFGYDVELCLGIPSELTFPDPFDTEDPGGPL